MANPHEAIETTGRGALWNFGPNYASDALIIADIEGVKHMVAIRRKSGHWAMPGGFRNVKDGALEDSRQAAFRELAEEAGILFSLNAQAHADLAYEGYVHDERNTRDAWIETAIYVLDIGSYPAPLLKVGDDAIEACYLALTPENIDALYPGHARLVLQVLTARGGPDVCEDCCEAMLESLAVDGGSGEESLLTKAFNELFALVMFHKHAHPNHLVRLDMALRLLGDITASVRARVERKLRPEERQQSLNRFTRFIDQHRMATAPEQIDEAIEMLPIYYAENEQRVQESSFTFMKPDRSVN